MTLKEAIEVLKKKEAHFASKIAEGDKRRDWEKELADVVAKRKLWEKWCGRRTS